MKCYDLFQLPSLNLLRIVAGEEGLHRKLQWFHFFDNINTDEYHLWVEKNNLIILTGKNLLNDYHSLCDILPMLAQVPIAGILFNVGMYIHELPEYLLQLANNLQLPIFTIPWEVKLSDVSKDICSCIFLEQNSKDESATLLSEFLFSNHLSIEHQNKLIHDLNFPFCNGFRIVIFQFSSLRKEPFDETSITKKTVAVAQYLAVQFKAQIATASASIISIMHRDSLLFLTDANCIEQTKIHSCYVSLQNALQQRFQGVQIHAGASRLHTNAEDCRLAYQEAQQAVWVAQAQNPNYILCHEKMGAFRLLTCSTNVKELESFYREILNPVITYDETNSGQLLDTLFSYLDHNKQLQETADALFIHKSTLKYRINKLKTLLKVDFDSSDCIMELVLARNVALLLNVKKRQ